MATFTIKVDIHDNVIKQMCDFFGVTKQKSRDMITKQLIRRTVDNKTVIVMASNDMQFTFDVCNSVKRIRETISPYEDHCIINLKSGEPRIMKSPNLARSKRVLRKSDGSPVENDYYDNE